MKGRQFERQELQTLRNRRKSMWVSRLLTIVGNSSSGRSEHSTLSSPITLLLVDLKNDLNLLA